MALKFFCSCGDDRTLAQLLQKWDVCNDFTVGSGYNGTNAFVITVAPYTRVRAVKKVTLTPSNRVIAGFRWHMPPGSAFPLSGVYAWYVLWAVHAGAGPYNESTKQVSLNLLNDGKLEVRRGGYAGTVLGTTASVVLANATWAYVELDVTVGPTGSVTLRVDDVVVLFLAGVNTQALGSAAINAVEWIPWTLDDVYLCDASPTPDNPYTTFLGSRFHVLATRAIAPSVTQWTPVSGTNLSNVAASGPDGACNRAAFAGAIDLFQPDPVDGAYPEILAVQSNLTGHRVSSASTPTVASVVEIDGVRYAGSADALGNADVDARTIWAMAPDTGDPWTRTVWNAAVAGYQRVT